MLFIAICTLGKVRAEWAASLVMTRQPMARASRLGLMSGMTTVEARNGAVLAARNLDAEYLLFWDDDVIPQDSEAIRRLVTAMDQEQEIGVIGGVYPARRKTAEPVVCEREGAGVFWGWRSGGISPVYMTGTGFMLIRLALLDEDGPWFGRSADLTDDFFFADYCRERGIRQFVHGGVVCDQVTLDGEMYSVPMLETVA